MLISFFVLFCFRCLVCDLLSCLLSSQSYMWLLTKWGWECARLLSSQNSPAGPARPGPSESTPRWRSAQVKARVFCPASRSSSMEVPSRWASSSLSLSSVMGSLSLAVPNLYSSFLGFDDHGPECSITECKQDLVSYSPQKCVVECRCLSEELSPVLILAAVPQRSHNDSR